MRPGEGRIGITLVHNGVRAESRIGLSGVRSVSGVGGPEKRGVRVRGARDNDSVHVT